MTVDTILFLFAAAAAVISALMMITRRNPVKAVLFLIVNFFCLAVLYLFLMAQFIAIIQILVYAGAIMVLFLFVIMLLNLGNEQALAERKTAKHLVAALLGAAVILELVFGMQVPWQTGAGRLSESAAQLGTIESIGKALYTRYLFPFEITSVLLLAAMVGVIILAKKKFQ